MITIRKVIPFAETLRGSFYSTGCYIVPQFNKKLNRWEWAVDQHRDDAYFNGYDISLSSGGENYKDLFTPLDGDVEDWVDTFLADVHDDEAELLVDSGMQMFARLKSDTENQWMSQEYIKEYKIIEQAQIALAKREGITI